jgi:hypothetical protein
MQDAGAAAIELNVYYLPGDPHIAGRDVEQHNYSIGGDASCTIRRTRTRSDATPPQKNDDSRAHPRALDNRRRLPDGEGGPR